MNNNSDTEFNFARWAAFLDGHTVMNAFAKRLFDFDYIALRKASGV